MESWQLPELLGIVVSADGEVPLTLSDSGTDASQAGVAVPMVPEVC